MGGDAVSDFFLEMFRLMFLAAVCGVLALWALTAFCDAQDGKR